jgi:transporter family-2 protein
MSGLTQANFWPIAGLMIAAGIGIPIMATLNAGVGQQLQNPVAASLILFVLGAGLCALALTISGTPNSAQLSAVPPWRYLGALLVVFYILSITWAGPRIGIGNAIFFVLIGQLIAAAAIDHFGLWGAAPSPITAKRALGIAVMALGVWLAKKPL